MLTAITIISVASITTSIGVFWMGMAQFFN